MQRILFPYRLLLAPLFLSDGLSHHCSCCSPVKVLPGIFHLQLRWQTLPLDDKYLFDVKTGPSTLWMQKTQHEVGPGFNNLPIIPPHLTSTSCTPDILGYWVAVCPQAKLADPTIRHQMLVYGWRSKQGHPFCLQVFETWYGVRWWWNNTMEP